MACVDQIIYTNTFLVLRALRVAYPCSMVTISKASAFWSCCCCFSKKHDFISIYLFTGVYTIAKPLIFFPFNHICWGCNLLRPCSNVVGLPTKKWGVYAPTKNKTIRTFLITIINLFTLFSNYSEVKKQRERISKYVFLLSSVAGNSRQWGVFLRALATSA